MNVKVEYEETPIRHIAVECPECGNWFYGNDITDDNLTYIYNVRRAVFHCPVCHNTFDSLESGGLDIQEESYPDVYNSCLHKKVVLE